MKTSKGGGCNEGLFILVGAATTLLLVVVVFFAVLVRSII